MATPITTDLPAYEAIILAGGQGSRMGHVEKGLQVWGGKPLFRHAQALLAHQSPPPHRIWLNANRHSETYALCGLTVIADSRAGFAGPLAGMEAGLQACTLPWLLCIPCDMPLLPIDLAARLFAAVATGAPAAYAVAADRVQPVCCLLPRTLLPSLTATLDAGHGKVMGWLSEVGAVPTAFDDARPFRNFNTLADLQGSSESTP